jgi:hypothetical protein
MAVVSAGFVLFANIEATLVLERTQRRSLVAEQRKLSGDGIQYPARTGRLALFRFKMKAGKPDPGSFRRIIHQLRLGSKGDFS